MLRKAFIFGAIPMLSCFSILQKSRPKSLAIIASVCWLGLSLGGCVTRGGETTGSISASDKGSNEGTLRQQAQMWGQRFDANPADANAAINYARALRGLDQRAQAVAVLQQSAIRSPRNMELLGAYGKALADVGRLKEASEVLSRAHTPERPDWRILSAQGAVADQMGDYATAQRYYETALKIVPNEPSILSNLGLSYALSQRLPEAERVLRLAQQNPRADSRIYQNLALVLGLQGKFGEAESALQRIMPAAEAAGQVATMRRMVSQNNSWDAIRKLDGKGANRSSMKLDAKARSAAPAVIPAAGSAVEIEEPAT
jgi:Flp pilus assembly protein TadD